MADQALFGAPRRNILVIEDDAMVGMALVDYLEELGATVTWSTDIGSALAHIDGGGALDVAIVDLNLNGTMSTPVIDHLIARNVPTILCTGYEAASIEDRFRHLPRSEKPFTRVKIRSFVTACLAGSNGPTSSASGH